MLADMATLTDSESRCRALVVRTAGLDPDGRLTPMRPTRPKPNTAERDAALLRAIERISR
jgi:hypothetical protein